MKKYIILFFALLMTITAFSQVADSVNVVYHFGDSVKEFLKQNLFSILFALLFVTSELIGENSKIKESSVYKFVYNLLYNFLKKRSGAAKVILFICALGIGSQLQAQDSGKFKGFFKPVPDNMLLKPLRYGGTGVQDNSTWLFRPAVQLTAMQLYYNKETKDFTASTFQSAGIGISYQKFIQADGEAVSNFGVSGLLLFDNTAENVRISPAVTVSALNYFNVGAGYNTGLKKIFFLTGITYSFN